MFGSDCAAALALTLRAMEIDARLWEMRGPDRWAGTMSCDTDVWAERGIETAADLADMLQAEWEKEERKSSYIEGGFETMADYRAWDAETRAWIAAEEAKEAAANAEEAEWKVWDYEVTDNGRVRFVA